MIKNRSNATSNQTDSAENDQEPGHATTKQNKFLQAFGNIFNEMKGNSILQHVVCNMHQFRCSSSVKKWDEINIEFVSDKYALDDIIDDSQGWSLWSSNLVLPTQIEA